jgi:hypothetical protein
MMALGSALVTVFMALKATRPIGIGPEPRRATAWYRAVVVHAVWPTNPTSIPWLGRRSEVSLVRGTAVNSPSVGDSQRRVKKDNDQRGPALTPLLMSVP